MELKLISLLGWFTMIAVAWAISLAPERRGEMARLGLRAMIGGLLAAYMAACLAGFLL